MLRIVKVGGMLVAAGVVVAGVVIGYLRLRPVDAVATSHSNGGTMVLDAAATPLPSPGAFSPGAPGATPGLQVLSPSTVASSGGGADGLLGRSSSAAGSSRDPTPAPAAASVPSPDSFAQYDQYKDSSTALFGDIKVGDGPAVAVGSTLAVAYRGWLTNGTEFDESYSGGKPFVFKEGDHKVITGWEEGLLGMKVGGKRRLIVPPGVGYGQAGRPPQIPGGAVLVFDVELVAVQ